MTMRDEDRGAGDAMTQRKCAALHTMAGDAGNSKRSRPPSGAAPTDGVQTDDLADECYGGRHGSAARPI